jgi:hypothetical protein
LVLSFRNVCFKQRTWRSIAPPERTVAGRDSPGKPGIPVQTGAAGHQVEEIK